MTESTETVTGNVIYYSTNNENTSEGALYLMISKSDEFPEEDGTVVNIRFIHEPSEALSQTTKSELKSKTWQELTNATNVDFISFVNMFSEEIIEAQDSAKLFASPGEGYEEILELCKNIADAIKLGGKAPDDAGQIFKEYYRPPNGGITNTIKPMVH